MSAKTWPYKRRKTFTSSCNGYSTLTLAPTLTLTLYLGTRCKKTERRKFHDSANRSGIRIVFIAFLTLTPTLTLTLNPNPNLVSCTSHHLRTTWKSKRNRKNKRSRRKRYGPMMTHPPACPFKSSSPSPPLTLCVHERYFLTIRPAGPHY